MPTVGKDLFGPGAELPGVAEAAIQLRDRAVRPDTWQLVPVFRRNTRALSAHHRPPARGGRGSDKLATKVRLVIATQRLTRADLLGEESTRARGVGPEIECPFPSLCCLSSSPFIAATGSNRTLEPMRTQGASSSRAAARH